MAAVLPCVGCGNSSGLVEVSGTVTLDGKPVEAGQIDFYPEVGRPASGAIGSDGGYTLTTTEPGDGAKPGKYVVTVTARQAPDTEPMYRSIEDEMNGVQANAGGTPPGGGRVKWLIPPQYSNRAHSGLTAEVTPGGGTIDFPLTSNR